MSKEAQDNELNTNKALHIADVGGSIFFNVPLIAYEKTRLKLSKEELEKLKKLTNLENPPVKQDTQPLLQTSQEKQIIDTIHKDITILENNNSSIPSKQQDVDSIKKEIQKHLEAIKSLQKKRILS